ncbi:MAG: hypothetical protein ACEPOV_04155 [Hyphomicrobiales bacterium]
MMKRILYIIFLIGIALSSHAQNLSSNHRWKNNVNVTMRDFHGNNGKFEFKFLDNDGKDIFAIYAPRHGYIFSAKNSGRVAILDDGQDSDFKFYVNAETYFQGNIYYTPGKRFLLRDIGNNNAQDYSYVFNRSQKSDQYIFRSPGNAPIMTIRANGSVNIGTYNSSTYDFVVSGVAKFEGATTFRDDFVVYSSSFGTNSIVKDNGRLGVGTTNPEEMLHVVGDMKVEGDFLPNQVTLNVGTFPDYVFEDDYKLISLEDTEDFIKENKHLPNVPSAKKMLETGMDAEKMNIILMEKVEELMLHSIEQHKQLKELEKEAEKFLQDID